MRFGKKLAILTQADDSKVIHRPYIAHTALKRELASVVTRLRNEDGCDTNLDVVYEFGSVFAISLLEIHSHIKTRLDEFNLEINAFKDAGRQLGFFGTDTTKKLLISINEVLTSNREILRSALSDSLSATWFAMTVEMAKSAESYDLLAVRMESFLGYVDLNIAGFRKISKQFYKQTPPSLHSNFSTFGDYKCLSANIIDTYNDINEIRISVQTILDLLLPDPPKLRCPSIGKETLDCMENMDSTKDEKTSADSAIFVSSVAISERVSMGG